MLDVVRRVPVLTIRTWTVALVAAFLSVPVVLFPLFDYDINPAFLLVPLIASAFFVAPRYLSGLYALSFACGLLSIFAVSRFSPDGDTLRHVFSLVLIMFAPSFVFLGRKVGSDFGAAVILRWFAVFSSLFIIIVALRIVLLGQGVRIFVGPLGLASMNAEFLGVPVFAAFGVLSLAHLFCLQILVAAGALLNEKSKAFSVLFGLGVFFAAFLIMGSDSRSAQVLFVWVLAAIGLYAILDRSLARRSFLITILIMLGAVYAYSRMPESRMEASIAAITSDKEPVSMVHSQLEESLAEQSLSPEPPLVVIDNVEVPAAAAQVVMKADAFATGRVELAINGVREFVASPWVGNGFSSYGRFDADGETSAMLKMNSSTHLYYLTILWKGGLLFAVPFGAMLILVFIKAFRAGKESNAKLSRYYTWSTVLMAFGPMSLAWDILIVPSAGALAFFLLGVLSVKDSAEQKVS